MLEAAATGHSGTPVSGHFFDRLKRKLEAKLSHRSDQNSRLSSDDPSDLGSSISSAAHPFDTPGKILTFFDCALCAQPILDKFIMKLDLRCFHERCLVCSSCSSPLDSICYQRDSKLYCRRDYLRIFCRKCDSCGEAIQPNELVMRPDDQRVYHLNCFCCEMCGSRLKTGEQFSCLAGQLLCKAHLPLLDNSNIVPCSGPEVTTNCIGALPVCSPAQSTALSCSSIALHNNQSAHSSSVGDHQSSLIDGSLHTTANCSSPPTNHSLMASGSSFGSPARSSGGLSPVNVKRESGNSSTKRNRTDGRRGPKRPRTILTTAQRRAFKTSFESSQKPCRKVREALAKETGLSVRIVQVWFQNQRAKLKKIQRKQLQQQHLPPHALSVHQHGASHPHSSPRSSMAGGGFDETSDTSEELGHFEFGHSPGDGSYYSPNDFNKANMSLDYDDSDEDEMLLAEELDETSVDHQSDPQSTAYEPIGQQQTYSKAEPPIAPSSASDLMTGSPPLGMAVAQAMTSSATLCAPSAGCTTAGGLMTPIDKLYSMQNSYFNALSDCENCP